MSAVLIGGAIIAANAIAQAYVANKQMGAEQDRLDDIRAEFDRIKPPELNMSLDEYITKNKGVLPDYGNLPTFEFLTPEQFKAIEKYNPEFAGYVAQKSPELVKRSAVGEEGLSAQRQALRKLMLTGSLEQDPELMQKFSEADRNAQIGAQSRQQSLMQDYARRGQAGSGLQLAAQLGAGESAMDRSAQMSQQAASEAYRNRLQQLMQGAQLGGQMEQRDIGLQGSNADIINRFNEMTSKNYQNWLNQKANTANEAQKYNIEQAQDVANKNVNLQNAYKQNMANVAQWGYGQNVAAKQNAFNNAMNAMNAENQAQMQKYDAATAKAKAMAGIPTVDKWGYMSPIIQKAADFGTQWAASNYAQGAENQKQDREDARMEYWKTGKWPSKGEG